MRGRDGLTTNRTRIPSRARKSISESVLNNGLLRRGVDHRLPYYTCSSYSNRGSSICSNLLRLPMEQADVEVLDQFAEHVLDKDIVEGAIMDAIAELRPAADAVSATRAGLEAEIRKIEAEQGRLVEGIALAGDVAVLTSALKDREGRLTHLRREFAAVTGAGEIACFDTRRIEKDLRKKIDEWRGLVRRQTPIARQMLTKLIDGRLVFAPDVEQKCYTFTGTATLGNLLKGVVFPKETALPLVVRPQRDSGPTAFRLSGRSRHENGVALPGSTIHFQARVSVLGRVGLPARRRPTFTVFGVALSLNDSPNGWRGRRIEVPTDEDLDQEGHSRRQQPSQT